MAYGQKYLRTCKQCGGFTNSKYARDHAGRCKSCADPDHAPAAHNSRNARIIDSGYDAYAREEGHYDLPDYA